MVFRLPPGPFGLPFFGVANKLPPSNVREVLQEWKDKYGDIYSFTLPGQSIVVVSIIPMFPILKMAMKRDSRRTTKTKTFMRRVNHKHGT